MPVVVGIDGSSSALDAARWAAREAARRRTTVQLISAFGWLETSHLGDHGLSGRYRETLLRSTRAEVSAAAEAAAEAAPGVEISERVIDGFPVPLLVAASRRADLVVLGDRGLGGFTALLVGSVAIGLAARAECPVVVVRGERASDAGPVVVGIDGSQISEAALAFAFEAAVTRKVPLIAVHAWNDSVLEAAVAPLLDWDAIEADEHRLLAEMRAWCAVLDSCPKPIEHEPGPPVHFTLLTSTPRMRGGRVGVTTESRGCAECRPRLGGAPVFDETVAAGFLRDCLWSRSACEARPQREVT